MNKVKMVPFVVPLRFKILNDELDVWSHPARLDRADVISNDVGIREFPTSHISAAGIQ